MSECVENKGTCNDVAGGNIGSNPCCNRGVRGIFGKDTALLFFFLLLVIIFCNCGIFRENGSELLFFLLLLVVLFGGGRFFRY